MAKRKVSLENIIPLPPKPVGETDVGGVGQINKNIDKINTRMETVTIALLVAFVVALISVFGIFIDAYKFHAESYQEFKQTLSDQQKYNKDYNNLENSVKELTKQVGEINLILKNNCPPPSE